MLITDSLRMVRVGRSRCSHLPSRIPYLELVLTKSRCWLTVTEGSNDGFTEQVMALFFADDAQWGTGSALDRENRALVSFPRRETEILRCPFVEQDPPTCEVFPIFFAENAMIADSVADDAVRCQLLSASTCQPVDTMGRLTTRWLTDVSGANETPFESGIGRPSVSALLISRLLLE